MTTLYELYQQHIEQQSDERETVLKAQTTGHGKMITVRQFMQRHALSQIEFQALQNHIKASYPDQTLTRKVNATDLKIVDVDLFEQYLASIQIATNH